MIISTKPFFAQTGEPGTFIKVRQLCSIISKDSEFQDDLTKLFEVVPRLEEVLQVGNAKNLIDAINSIDNLCDKIDIVSTKRDIKLDKYVEDKQARFQIFGIDEPSILIDNKSDLLEVVTRYDAKADLLDMYNFSKFANYCNENGYDDLIDQVKGYLEFKNVDNSEEVNLRLLRLKEDGVYYLRAKTSVDGYKNFGINFSVFVAILAMADYAKKSSNSVFIDRFTLQDSSVYVSFAFSNSTQVNTNIKLTFSLILENDEVKRRAVSFNGMFKLDFKDSKYNGTVYLKPGGIRNANKQYSVDILNYAHKGSVAGVLEKMKELPNMIDAFIKQCVHDANIISKISNPQDVKDFLSKKIIRARKNEFQAYKKDVYKKLMATNVDTTFKLFDLLRQVEDLFDHDDVQSVDFWRGKLYEALTRKE